MKKILIPASVALAATFAIAANTVNDDPVLMTVDGRDVHVSEFDYLYNKNNTQQLQPLDFDKYVDMFVNYKLKVADALNMQIDTTSAYKAELAKFRRDLAQPYMVDSAVYRQLIEEAYSHSAEDVYVSHIMLPAQDPQGKTKLDSIRSLIIDGTITFEQAAQENSVDTRSGKNGGRMGWVTGAGLFPWPFERAAYNTTVGEISPVINSGVGYHLVRPEERRKALGEVKVEHILLLTRGLDEDGMAHAKNRIDSLYAVVTTPGVKFSDVASVESDDKASAQKGGLIDWFGAGQMVAEFDSVSFALPDGAISEPFQTRFGYHIVHKLAHRDAGTLEQMRPTIEKQIAADARHLEPVRARLNAIAHEAGASLDPTYKQVVSDAFAANGYKADSVLFANLRSDITPLYTINGTTCTLGQALANTALRPTENLAELNYYVDNSVQSAYDNALTDYEIGNLYERVPAYRNLLNEYSDGILLFDASQLKVWEKAAKDTKNLSKYFNKNKKKYSNWESPRYKAYVIFVSNDSLANEVEKYAQMNYGKLPIEKINQEAFTSDLKDKYGSQIKVERVIAGKGENKITDYLAFDGEKPENKSSTFKTYFAFAGKIIEQPEEYLDVKGQVLADYQSFLENEWINWLHKNYKVVINQDVLQSIKK